MKRAFAVAAGLCLAAGCASLAGIKNNYHAGHHPDAGGNGGAATGGAGVGGSAGGNQQDASGGSGGLDGGGAGASAVPSCVGLDAGTSQVTIAKMKDQQPLDIAVDCSGVYFTTQGNGGGSVMRVPPGGGAAKPIATGTQPYGIALDNKYVYWTDPGTDNGVGAVMRTDKQQHTTMVLASGSTQGTPSGITVHNNYVYWTAMSSDEVYRMSTVSPQNDAGIEAIAGHNGPDGIAVDSTRVVWGSANAVRSAPLADLDGGTKLNNIPTSAVALGNGFVFWIERGQDAGGIGWSLVDGGGIVRISGKVVTNVLAPPWGIAADGQYVYWTDSVQGLVEKRSPYQAPVMKLASGDHPAGIFVFGDSVYWTNAGTPTGGAGYSGASVMRIHK